ncbi:C-C motif chemokine 16 [Echinops telfairi]|uniref:C-C motif chemokine n=1 Tax=Echinops telfairi TaxID=9371 RepID=A0ABM0ITN6_ECHTE|nr:C-C motif chemokine 16 [Echinops telfairi]
MKVSVTALLLLVFTFTVVSAYHSQPRIPESANPPPSCCLKHTEKVLPRKLVAGYIKALSCPLPSIIFVTKKNREICANPGDDWVQEYIKKLPLLPPRSLA